MIMDDLDPSIYDPQDGQPAPPPKAPRATSPRGRWRSWLEPAVVIWWLLASIVMVIAVAATWLEIRATARDRSIIGRGEKITALVQQIDNASMPSRKNYRPAPERNPDAMLNFTLKDGRAFELVPLRLDRQRDKLVVGETLEIYVDPADPRARLTDRLGVSPMDYLFLLVLLAPAAALAGIVAAIRRAGMLRTWRLGEAMLATCVDTQTSALHPFSRQVTLALCDSADRRAIKVVMPGAGGIPEVDEPIWILMRNRQPRTAIVARLYA